MPPFRPEENSWYVMNEVLHFVIGFKPNGDCVWQVNNGNDFATGSGEVFRNAVLLPECTGWDWKPPEPQAIGGKSGSDQWTGLRLWTYRTIARGDRYVFIAAEKGNNDWVEVVFNGEGWVINE